MKRRQQKRLEAWERGGEKERKRRSGKGKKRKKEEKIEKREVGVPGGKFAEA